MAPTFYIHLYWSEDQQCYKPKEDALEIYEKEIDLFVKQHSSDLFFQEKSDQDKHFIGHLNYSFLNSIKTTMLEKK